MTIPRAPRKAGKPNLAPLIDVVFLLLIFFLLTSTLITADRYETELPEARNGAIDDEPALVLIVSRAGGVALNNKTVPPDRLVEELRLAVEDNPGRRTALKADARARAADVVRVLKGAREAGLDRIGLAVEPVGP